MTVPLGSSLVRALLDHPGELPVELLTVLTEELIGHEAEKLAVRLELPAHLSRRLLDRHAGTDATFVFATAYAKHLSGPPLVEFLEELCDPPTGVVLASGVRARVAKSLTGAQVATVLDSDSLPAVALIAANAELGPAGMLTALLRAFALVRAGGLDVGPPASAWLAAQWLDGGLRTLAGRDRAAAQRALLACPTWRCLERHLDTLVDSGEDFTDAELAHLVTLLLDDVDAGGGAGQTAYLLHRLPEVVTRYGAHLPEGVLRRIVDHPLAGPATVAAATAALQRDPVEHVLGPDDPSGAAVAHLLREMEDTGQAGWKAALVVFADQPSGTPSPRVADVVGVVRAMTSSTCA